MIYLNIFSAHFHKFFRGFFFFENFDDLCISVHVEFSKVLSVNFGSYLFWIWISFADNLFLAETLNFACLYFFTDLLYRVERKQFFSFFLDIFWWLSKALLERRFIVDTTWSDVWTNFHYDLLYSGELRVFIIE